MSLEFESTFKAPHQLHMFILWGTFWAEKCCGMFGVIWVSVCQRVWWRPRAVGFCAVGEQTPKP